MVDLMFLLPFHTKAREKKNVSCQLLPCLEWPQSLPFHWIGKLPPSFELQLVLSTSCQSAIHGQHNPWPLTALSLWSCFFFFTMLFVLFCIWGKLGRVRHYCNLCRIKKAVVLHKDVSNSALVWHSRNLCRSKASCYLHLRAECLLFVYFLFYILYKRLPVASYTWLILRTIITGT